VKEIFNIIIGIVGMGFGWIAFALVWNKHKRIDTESIAVVKEVESLGRDDGRKIFATWYDVKSSEPFDLLDTPCKKNLPIGTERVVFYEKEDPNNNHYFKTFRQFDKRFIMPSALFFAGFVVAAAAIVNLLF